MKIIASIFISIIMVTSLYTSMQTNAAGIMSFSIIRYPTHPDAPSTYYLANGIVDFESVFYLESQEITKDIMQQIISIINKI